MEKAMKVRGGAPNAAIDNFLMVKYSVSDP
jgi:hypothetical protein